MTDANPAICNLTKSDFAQSLSGLADFWGNARTAAFHHPMFLYEFGNTAFVIKDSDTMIAYLFGFFSQTAPLAYVHLIGVRQTPQRRGLGRKLYEHFSALVKTKECREVKAITTPLLQWVYPTVASRDTLSDKTL
ncbi:MAG: GNAT family N-acetyltransferase [Acidobacteria bacterium]|nr:GNAT family N-acetyltransferase [Acidobacteriota bacterium]